MDGLIALVYDNTTYQADLALGDNGLIRKDGAFETVVTASLYSWARDVNVDTQEASQKFGWWGAQFGEDANDNYGSLMWRHARGKNSPAERSKINKTLADALDWMTADGIADDIVIVVERLGLQAISASIKITRADGKRWDSLWEIQRDAIL
jgi:phage gp46-like protein